MRFLQDWFDETELSYDAMLGIELYPWHGKAATGPIRPDPRVIRELVLEPLADSDMLEVFAFGADWFPMLIDHVGVNVVARLGAGGKITGHASNRGRWWCARDPSGYGSSPKSTSGRPDHPRAIETLRLRDAIEQR